MKSGFSGLEMVDSHHSRRIPPIDLKNRRTFTPFTTLVRKNGNCAQCSTEFTPMIECCVQGSIHPEVARVEPLLEQDPRCER